MAERDINIPFGPDKTGEFKLSNTVPEIGIENAQPASQPINSQAAPLPSVANSAPMESGLSSEAPADFSALPDSAFEPAPQSAYAEATRDDVVVMPASDPAPSSPGAADDQPQTSDSIDSETVDEGEDEENGAAQALDSVQMSFAALRDSIGQGRELKAREKELEALEDKMEIDREELADRDNILVNYHALVAEQDDIIMRNTQQRDANKAELARIAAQIEETSEALSRMRDYHDVQLQPLETALGRARATADQAKNDERSRKSELNAAETEARRAADGDDSTMAKAKLEQVQLAYDEAVARSNAAKEALEEAQRAYDDLHDQVEQAESPLEHSLEDLQKQTEELKDEVNKLGDTISAASKRRQYCDSVYQYPEETEKLRRSIQADEESALQMDRENDELREQLAVSKSKSTKAKIAIAAVIVLIIIIVCAVWYFSAR